jgi:hypothetical protein
VDSGRKNGPQTKDRARKATRRTWRNTSYPRDASQRIRVGTFQCRDTSRHVKCSESVKADAQGFECRQDGQHLGRNGKPYFDHVQDCDVNDLILLLDNGCIFDRGNKWRTPNKFQRPFLPHTPTTRSTRYVSNFNFGYISPITKLLTSIQAELLQELEELEQQGLDERLRGAESAPPTQIRNQTQRKSQLSLIRHNLLSELSCSSGVSTTSQRCGNRR